jgi:hypothetical protein
MPNDNRQSNRHQRAADLIDSETERVKRCIDDVATLSRDTREVVCEVLEGGDYNASRWIADMTALSAAAYRAVSHFCGHASSVPESGTTVVVPSGELLFLFDVRSEMAGPLEIAQANPPLAFTPASDLTGPDGAVIPGDKVVVRCVNDRVFLTLRDLKGVAPGTYTGAVTITDATGTPTTRPIRAECRATLWWG